MLDECYCLVSPLNANQRPQARHAAGEACLLGRGNDRGYVLVGARRFLGDAAHRRAFNDDAPFCKIIDDLASAPLLERGVPRQIDANGGVVDGPRIDYLRANTAAMFAAVDAGAEVRGYSVWPLLDNFEWGSGFGQRFGLVSLVREPDQD